MTVRPTKPMPGIGKQSDWQIRNGVCNAIFAKTDETFKKKCEKAKVEPTKRQASKYRRKFGSAYSI
jgi:hypothetical protein